MANLLASPTVKKIGQHYQSYELISGGTFLWPTVYKYPELCKIEYCAHVSDKRLSDIPDVIRDGKRGTRTPAGKTSDSQDGVLRRHGTSLDRRQLSAAA